ncbi:TetR/AcrR family transcriptional regulator [Mycobacterium frederiksbergense]|uniref:TetR/AcrR family transcriptional regulator n=1 Tax=Mycolicibacterium frederiksbergense TaxID=117567 RepID=UPI0021F2BBFB|nr:TetR/AcrR family transcriptional regulator [Mycolicibacterium frederiksbergense]MCV7043561.1 TetR/AcrR family transcriptional regulator [Mycolicibacterium frederiksbergense]
MPPTKRQRQGEDSREVILDATERLMSTQGYAATSISHIRRETGLPASSIYWHFGSKEGVLAAVMERGAERYFAQIPRNSPDIETQRAAVAKLMVANPDFFRLLYMLSLERSDHPAVAAAVRRVRDTAISGFAEVIRQMLPEAVPPEQAERVVTELAAVATAMSDGVFFAEHLEPDSTDVDRMYVRLIQAVEALIPILLEEN